LYLVSLTSDQQDITFLDTEQGKVFLASATDELLNIRDANHNGLLDWNEFSNVYLSKDMKHQYWRLAPLLDVKIQDFDQIIKDDPNMTTKLFFCGALASSSAKSFGAPFSRVAILQQTLVARSLGQDLEVLSNVQLARHLYKEEGIRGFFRGNFTDVLRCIPSGGITYTSYEILKRFLIPYFGQENENKGRFIAGGSAGVVTLLSVYPMDVVRTRLVVQTKTNTKYAGILDAFKQIKAQEGVKALYRGSLVASIQTFPTMALNYSIFDFTKRELEKIGIHGLFGSVTSGVVSGFIASSTTFPMDVVIRNVQLGKGSFKGPLDCFQHIWKNQGPSGFFRGYAPMLIRCLPQVGISFGVYDTITRYMGIKLH
jgi:solute carrier family 25 phosphate transporter 23/24/25/41